MQHWNYSSTEKVFIADLKFTRSLVSSIFSGKPTPSGNPTTPSSAGASSGWNLGPKRTLFPT